MTTAKPRRRAPRPSKPKAKAGSRRLAIARNLDIYEAASLKAEFLAHISRESESVLDLSGVVDADTAGLQVLLLARRECEARGGTLRLDGCSPAVADLLALFGLADAFGAPA